MENLEITGLWEKFDEWKSKQSTEQLKRFYDNVEKITSSNNEWFEFRAKNMSRVLGCEVYTKEINGGKYIIYKEKRDDK